MIKLVFKSQLSLTFLLFFCCLGSVFAQTPSSKDKYRLTGIIRDNVTGQPLEGVGIYCDFLKKGAQSNATGYFYLDMPPGTYSIYFTIIGYKPKDVTVSMRSSKEITVTMEQTEKELEEVVVRAEKADANVSRPQMGVERLSIKTIKQIPTLMGEADVIRSLMLLPGVVTVGEGATGFNVRGGNVDQNLVLLDGVPIFNTSHLFGFFTAFNADAVQDVSLFKGGVPANFGGRASSVLDVRLKNGDFNKFSMQGGVGPVASRVQVEMPLWKGHTSLIMAGRGSFSDFYLRYFPGSNLKQSQANFYDVNAKLTHKIGDKHLISVGGYQSYDYFRFSSDTAFFSTTGYVNASYNAKFSNKLSNSLTGYIAKYDYGSTSLDPQYGYRWNPGITYENIKEQLTYETEKLKLDAGGERTAYLLAAGNLEPTTDSSIINPFRMPAERSIEYGAFLNGEYKISPKVTLAAGLRYADFSIVGPNKQFVYESGQPRDLLTLRDSVIYTKGQRVSSYRGLEPRLSLNLKLNSTSSIKLSYNRMRQFLHLLSNTTAISPIDLWKNSNQYIPPQVADQYAAGFFKNFYDNAIESSVEVYYKNLPSLVDFRDGAQLFLNRNIETELVTGRGYAYGAEFSLKKSRGLWTGWVSYTYARTFRIVEATADQEAVNFGNVFPASFDIPNSVKVVATRKLGPRVSFNTTFTYNTGRPITFPNARYKIYAFSELYDALKTEKKIPANNEEYNLLRPDQQAQQIYFYHDGYSTPSFSNRNAERIPDYHRLDVSLNIDGKQAKKWKNNFNIAVYNLYGRRNAYSIFFRSTTGRRNQAKTYRLSVLGSAIPSLTYNFKF
jgi:hypothetical protein